MNEENVLAYIASHKDLIELYRRDMDENFIALKNDYLKNGEERGTYFDPMLYLILNPTVFAEVQGDLLQATKHYIQNGYTNEEVTSMRNIKPDIFMEHEFIKENPEQYLLILSKNIPNLSQLIENTDHSIINAKLASEITSTILNVTPGFITEVYNSLKENYN